MKLISESIEDIEYITEDDAEGKKNYRIRGVFLQAEVKNRNGRIYPMSVLEKEVSRYNKEYVKRIEHLENLDIQMVLQLI